MNKDGHMTSRCEMTTVIERVPACLRSLAQWVCWKYVERDGKQTKVPMNPTTGGSADSTDSSTWSTFEQAITACRNDSSLAGVGFVFTATDPFCGVDLDDCIEPATGQLKPWGHEMITRLASYTEISPSGNGVKVFLRAKKPDTRCTKPYADGEVEIYESNRFFTVTGQHLFDSPADVEDRQIELEAVYRQVFGDDDDNHAGVPSPIHPKPSDSGYAVADTNRRVLRTRNRRNTSIRLHWERCVCSAKQKTLDSMMLYYAVA
jgi:primase-polymerase (primpol)-like protein